MFIGAFSGCLALIVIAFAVADPPARRTAAASTLDGEVMAECAPVSIGEADGSPTIEPLTPGWPTGCVLGVLRNGDAGPTSVLCPEGIADACRELAAGDRVIVDGSPVPPRGAFWVPSRVVRVRAEGVAVSPLTLLYALAVVVLVLATILRHIDGRRNRRAIMDRQARVCATWEAAAEDLPEAEVIR